MRRVLSESGLEPAVVLRETPAIQKAWLRGDPLPYESLAKPIYEALGTIEAAQTVRPRAVAEQPEPDNTIQQGQS
jgi:hypothetical protein